MFFFRTTMALIHGPDTDELLRRISKCRDIEFRFSSLPKHFFDFVTCRDSVNLDITELRVTSLPSLPIGLKYLNCSHTLITSLPPLPPGLIHLDCNDTPLTSLPRLTSSLNGLDCSNTQITSLPELPASLQVLICSNTQITSLPELPSSLTGLDCSNTQITSLPEYDPHILRVLKYSNTPLDKRALTLPNGHN